jgi:hypothetical protein
MVAAIHPGWLMIIRLVVWNMNFMTFHILGMSSSQLTNSYFKHSHGKWPIEIDALPIKTYIKTSIDEGFSKANC